MFIPKSLYYTKDHLWLMRVGANQFFIGMTDYAQKAAGKISRIELHLRSTEIHKNKLWGKIYGHENTLDLVLPFDCEIENINDTLNQSLINAKPYSNWLIRASSNVSSNSFLSSEEYKEFIGAAQKQVL